MKKISLAAAGAVMLGAAGMSQAATVDFGGFASGDVLGAGTNLGGGIIADISATGGTGQAVIFDTNAVTGGDVDLGSPFTDSVTSASRGFDNALIVQENAGDPIVPDDAVGGALLFEFASLVFLNEVFLLDTAEETFVTLFSGASVVATLTVDSSNESDTPNNVFPNEFTLLDFGGAKGDAVLVSFSESGAVGEFSASVVPVPAGLPLLLAGLGAFGVMRRRQKG